VHIYTEKLLKEGHKKIRDLGVKQLTGTGSEGGTKIEPAIPGRRDERRLISMFPA
jgi:hypothetical protein